MSELEDAIRRHPAGKGIREAVFDDNITPINTPLMNQHPGKPLDITSIKNRITGEVLLTFPIKEKEDINEIKKFTSGTELKYGVFSGDRKRPEVGDFVVHIPEYPHSRFELWTQKYIDDNDWYGVG